MSVEQRLIHAQAMNAVRRDEWEWAHFLFVAAGLSDLAGWTRFMGKF